MDQQCSRRRIYTDTYYVFLQVTQICVCLIFFLDLFFICSCLHVRVYISLTLFHSLCLFLYVFVIYSGVPRLFYLSLATSTCLYVLVYILLTVCYTICDRVNMLLSICMCMSTCTLCIHFAMSSSLDEKKKNKLLK